MAVSGHAPQLLPWVISCYGAHSKLYCQGKATLSSDEGVQQGDPSGPLLFALAWHKVVKDSAVAMIWSSWYLDDGHLVGNIRDLASAFATNLQSKGHPQDGSQAEQVQIVGARHPLQARGQGGGVPT